MNLDDFLLLLTYLAGATIIPYIAVSGMKKDSHD
jgi:hypothetical protein